MTDSKLCLKASLRSIDHRALEGCVYDIVMTAKKHGLNLWGPIPLPKRKIKEVKLAEHRRIIRIIFDEASKIQEVMQSFSDLTIPANVEVSVTDESAPGSNLKTHSNAKKKVAFKENLSDRIINNERVDPQGPGYSDFAREKGRFGSYPVYEGDKDYE